MDGREYRTFAPHYQFGVHTVRSNLYALISAVMVGYIWWTGEHVARMDVAIWIMVAAIFVQRQPE